MCVCVGGGGAGGRGVGGEGDGWVRVGMYTLVTNVQENAAR